MKDLLNYAARSKVPWEELVDWQDSILNTAKGLLKSTGTLEPVFFVRTFHAENFGHEAVEKIDPAGDKAPIPKRKDVVVCAPLSPFMDDSVPDPELIVTWTNKLLSRSVPSWSKFKEQVIQPMMSELCKLQDPPDFNRCVWNAVSAHFKLSVKDVASFFMKSMVEQANAHAALMINDSWIWSPPCEGLDFDEICKKYGGVPVSERPGAREVILATLETPTASRMVTLPYVRRDGQIHFESKPEVLESGAETMGRLQGFFSSPAKGPLN